MPFRLYSHEIAFHTPYLARLAEEAADGFEEARERFARIPRYADLDPARASLVEALEVSAIEHGFAAWREMEIADAGGACGEGRGTFDRLLPRRRGCEPGSRFAVPSRRRAGPGQRGGFDPEVRASQRGLRGYGETPSRTGRRSTYRDHAAGRNRLDARDHLGLAGCRGGSSRPQTGRPTTCVWRRA